MSARHGSMNRRGGRAVSRTAVGLAIALAVAAAPAVQATTVTRMTYDKGDHAASVTDPRGLVTSYAYDGLGQLWQQVSPDTGTTSYAYDAYGRRSSLTRANGVQTTYGYDGIGRLTSVSAGGQSQTFTYDTCTYGVARLCAASDATGTTSYSYTPEGWLTGRSFAIAGTSYALGYSYDALGHVTTVSYPDGNQATYAYTRGVVSGVTLTVGGNAVTGASAIGYRPGDLAMASWTSSNGLATTLGYDTDLRLTAISVPGVQSLGFTYDAANRITQIANGIDGSLTQNFGYDAQSRLTSVFGDAANESYSYDANGNRLTQVVNGASDTLSYAAASNRLLGRTGVTYSYDPQGNLASLSTGTTYQFDPFNRLAQAAGTSYYVNPEGQRLRKTSVAGTTYFAPDLGNALMAENDDGAWVDYVWLNGRLIGRIGGGQVAAIHVDQVGRPEAVTDASRALVWRAQNLAFTRNVVLANGLALNLGFPGQYYDAETGYWNNGFRDYDAAAGRYVESDPIGLAGGNNSYAYVGNNPLMRVDLLGLVWVYSQSTGMVTHVTYNGNVTTVKFVGFAYSGNGTGLNNPSMQGASGVGPIPQGDWGIGSQQDNVTGAGVTLYNSMRLSPSSGTDTFGRSGFLIHGDNRLGNHSASEGCIVAKPSLRDLIGNSGDNDLEVVP